MCETMHFGTSIVGFVETEMSGVNTSMKIIYATRGTDRFFSFDHYVGR